MVSSVPKAGTASLLTTNQRRKVSYSPVRRSMETRISADRKSTRLNSSHVRISYAVFCLKKKSENNIAAVGADASSKRRSISGGRPRHIDRNQTRDVVDDITNIDVRPQGVAICLGREILRATREGDKAAVGRHIDQK